MRGTWDEGRQWLTEFEGRNIFENTL